MKWEDILNSVDKNKVDPIVLEFIYAMIAINSSIIEQNKTVIKQNDRILDFNSEVLERLLADNTPPKELTNSEIIFTEGNTDEGV